MKAVSSKQLKKASGEVTCPRCGDNFERLLDGLCTYCNNDILEEESNERLKADGEWPPWDHFMNAPNKTAMGAMKITPEDFEELKNAFMSVYNRVKGQDLDKYTERLQADPKVKDLDMRIRWDIFHNIPFDVDGIKGASVKPFNAKAYHAAFLKKASNDEAWLSGSDAYPDGKTPAQCPACGNGGRNSFGYFDDGFDQYDEFDAVQDCRCKVCSATWKNYWRVQGYMGLEEHPENSPGHTSSFNSKSYHAAFLKKAAALDPQVKEGLQRLVQGFWRDARSSGGDTTDTGLAFIDCAQRLSVFVEYGEVRASVKKASDGLTMMSSGLSYVLQDELKKLGINMDNAQANQVIHGLFEHMERESQPGDSVQSPVGKHWTRL